MTPNTTESRPGADINPGGSQRSSRHRRKRKRTPSDVRGKIRYTEQRLAEERQARRETWETGRRNFIADEQERRIGNLYQRRRELRIELDQRAGQLWTP